MAKIHKGNKVFIEYFLIVCALSAELPDDVMQRLVEEFKHKAVFLVGCRARHNSHEWCYYDVVVYPLDGKKTIIDEKRRIALIPVNRPQQFPRSSTKLINDYNFYYAEAVVDDEKYFKVATKESLIRAIDYLLEGTRLGALATKLATLNVAKAILFLKGIEPSPSHMYDQLADAGGEHAGKALELLNLAEDLGLLTHRASVLQNVLPEADAKIFTNNIAELQARWPLKASLYLLTVVESIGKERLFDLLYELRFGALMERHITETFSLLKDVARMN